jgi:site-specific DNA recombinase
MRAAIYTRVSSQSQAEEGFSLEAQHDILMDLIERKGLQLYKVYSDPGVSGGSFKRPGIQMLIADMKAKKFEALLIHKLDRLSRNIGDLYQFIDLINKLDVRLIIASQGSEEIDTRSPMGKAFLFFSGIWAHIYLDNLREETLKGQIKKAQKGGKHISRPPLGYTFDSDYNLCIVEEEAKLVRTVFHLYLSGQGVVKIAKHMNTFSRGKEGGKWDSKAVRNIITNPTYAGYNHFKPAHWSDYQRIITNGDHEPIVTKEEFKQAQTYIERRTNKHMSKNSYNYPFSGIVRCGKCGATYTGNSSKHEGKVYKSYRCYNNYSKNLCDAQSISEYALTQLAFNHLFIIEDFYQQKETKQEEIDIQKEIEKSNRRRKNWMAALGDGHMTKEDYALAIEEEDERMKDIYSILEQRAAFTEPEIPLDELRHMILTVKDHWDSLSEETQKQFVQSAFRQITINKEKDEWKITELLTV